MESGSINAKKTIEALLFVTKKPLSAEELSLVLNIPADIVCAELEALRQEYQDRGLKIISVAHGYIMGTDPKCSEFVDRLTNSRIEVTLSPQSLETLSIIAYKQPVTKPEIEKIRGIYSDGVLDSLLSKKLIEEKGRGRGVGRPILYGTTEEFLRHFGLKDLDELPPLPEALPEQENLFKTALQ